MALQKLRCYLALSSSMEIAAIRDTVIAGVQQARFHITTQSQSRGNLASSANNNVIGEMAQCDCIVADLSDGNPNTYYEIGLAQAMGKGIFLLVDELSFQAVPKDLVDSHIYIYSRTPESIAAIGKYLAHSLSEFRRFPRRKSAPRGYSSQPFFVDWDRLSAADIENLCKELLTQMGFKKIDWETQFPEVDMVAELPKKDPDGFEYKELWLISMGLRAPAEYLVDMAMKDPEYLLHRLFRYFDEHRARLLAQSPVSFTILLITPRRGQINETYIDEQARRMRRGGSSNVRLRGWDQTYLTSLIHQFPQIGYKYFSDEGRLRSRTRMSYEDLYRENSQITNRLTTLVTELEDEKQRRITAERDAVWKDISFSAAHKIGNPIFAVETDLDPLLKRIRESRTGEAIEVVDNIRSAVEKAKSFVEQFKSLAKAQQIKVAPVSLRTIIEDAFQLICNQDVVCQVECPAELKILGDVERLSECFDELVANAIHWFDKPEKIIRVKVTVPPAEALPNILLAGRQYALIHFADNGKGIPLANKNKVFDAFFTTYQHGTGLGLALVRRIIEGHDGVISETGIPGEGADFEIYLPLSE